MNNDGGLSSEGNAAGRPQMSMVEKWLSLIGGGGLALYGLSRRSPVGVALAVVGGGLVYRGVTERWPAGAVLGILGIGPRDSAVPVRGITVEQTVTVNRPRSEVYQFWHNFENLPRFMTHLESVTVSGDGRSHWVAMAPLGRSVEWDAETINELEDKLIAWRSLGNTAVPNAGLVRFEDAPGGRGTVVRVALEYQPPAGLIGAAMDRLFRQEPNVQVEDDLRRFKEVMEAGEMPTVDGQSSGPRPGIGDEFIKGRTKGLDKIAGDDQVQQASEGSFPASDPPSWTSAVDSGV